MYFPLHHHLCLHLSLFFFFFSFSSFLPFSHVFLLSILFRLLSTLSSFVSIFMFNSLHLCLSSSSSLSLFISLSSSLSLFISLSLHLFSSLSRFIFISLSSSPSLFIFISLSSFLSLFIGLFSSSSLSFHTETVFTSKMVPPTRNGHAPVKKELSICPSLLCPKPGEFFPCCVKSRH